MTEYIDKKALLTNLDEAYEDFGGRSPGFYGGFQNALKRIKDFPTAEVEPVRRGQLGISYLDEYFGEFADCKECSTDNILPCNYCRWCGRKIDGGADNG